MRDKTGALNCPYCKKRDCLPEKVHYYIESFGPSEINVECRFCGEIIKTYGSRKIVFTGLKRTNKGVMPQLVISGLKTAKTSLAPTSRWALRRV